MTETEYNPISKFEILNDKLLKGMFIKAVPIHPEKNTLYGFIVSIDKSNVYSNTTILIKYNIINETTSLRQDKLLKIYPIKYDIYTKETVTAKRKMIISLLESFGSNTISNTDTINIKLKL